MEGFPLLTLPPLIQDKIIRKSQWRSYFRMQQTCKTVKEAIRKTRANTSVYIEQPFNIKFYKDVSEWRIRFLGKVNRRNRRVIKTSAIYGCRLDSLTVINTVPEEDFDEMCAILKKYKITCEKVTLGEYSFWTGNEWSALVEILKPVAVNYYHDTAENDFEVLLNFRQLQLFEIYLDKDDVSAVNGALKFLTTCPRVRIQAQDSTNPFFLIQYVLRRLSSKYCPNLEEFRFRLIQDSFEDEDLLEDPNLRQEESDDPEDRFVAQLILTEDFPEDASCYITIDNRDFVTIRYYRDAE